MSVRKLLKLPVPDLKQTLEKYLKSVRPFLTPKEFSVTLHGVEEFINGEGPYLQKLLQQRAERLDNWLSEWWIEEAYLSFRLPLPVFGSPFSTRFREHFHSTSDLLDYTANYIYGLIKFYEAVLRDELAPDFLGDKPLCMNQYYKLPGTYRIPGRVIDTIRLSPHSYHVLVLHKCRLYKLPVFVDVDGDKTQLLPYQVKHMLSHIVNTPDKPDVVPVGVVTTLDRPSWCLARDEMRKSPINRYSLDLIETSLFSLAIDEAGIQDYESSFTRTVIGDLRDDFRHFNRWYDIKLQKIISKDGYSSSIIEHTMHDGEVSLVSSRTAYSYIGSGIPDIPIESDLLQAEELNWEISPLLTEYIQDAKSKLVQLSHKLDWKVHTFSEFGKNLPKKCRMSPDSLIQLAIQLSYYKLHHKHGACYESVSTRKFHDGRTETLRSTSVESTDKVEAMFSNLDAKAKLRLLRIYLDAHKQYSLQASNGNGIDRHLLGLKILASKRNLSPRIFSDPGFIRSTHFHLSTSQLPNDSYPYLAYCPLVEDGYAVCYNPQETQIHFVISSFAMCEATVTANEFCQVLVQSLLDVKELIITESIQSNL